MCEGTERPRKAQRRGCTPLTAPGPAEDKGASQWGNPQIFKVMACSDSPFPITEHTCTL